MGVWGWDWMILVVTIEFTWFPHKPLLYSQDTTSLAVQWQPILYRSLQVVPDPRHTSPQYRLKSSNGQRSVRR